jgi:hypothetical protein
MAYRRCRCCVGDIPAIEADQPSDAGRRDGLGGGCPKVSANRHGKPPGRQLPASHESKLIKRSNL